MENSRKRRVSEMAGESAVFNETTTGVQSDERNGIVCIYNRKVNISNLVASDVSLYTLLRSWIQDDPNRVATCAELKGESIKSISQLNSGSHSALLQDCIDKVSAELHCDGKRRLVESSMTKIKSSDELDKAGDDNAKNENADIHLRLHLANWKLVRSRWHALTTAKYALVKTALLQKGVNCEEYVNIKQQQYYRSVSSQPIVPTVGSPIRTNGVPATNQTATTLEK